jgi:hypothetical protein
VPFPPPPGDALEEADADSLALAEAEADAEADAVFDALSEDSAAIPDAAEAAPGKARDSASSTAPVAVATPAATGSPALRVTFQERIRTGPLF